MNAPYADGATLGVLGLLAAMEQGDLTSAALVDALIARTEAAATLNCYVEFDAEGLRRQAREADARRARGQRRPLLGIPIALKDSIQALGLACGDGTRALHGRRCRSDAELVRRLRGAGALISGKLGMHELAIGITNNNAVTGAVRNPWDPTRIPGGSSGGAGAAVAARLIPAAIGTDTGGSVRVPAALCGVSGFRPTVGRVSGAGLAPIATTRDTAGPLARGVADLALLDGVLSGDTSALVVPRLAELRLGIPQSHFWDGLDRDVAGLAEQALSTLRSAGAQLVPIPLPGVAAASDEVGFVIVMHEFVRDMQAYLAQQGDCIELAELLAQVQSRDVKAIVEPLARGEFVSESDYRKALATRARLQSMYAGAFAESAVDALVFPTTPAVAARIGEDDFFSLGGRMLPTFPTFIRNTDPGSNAGLPGLSLPLGLVSGLPVGLALDGPAGSDRRLLAIGAAIEAVLPPMPAPPGPEGIPEA